MGIGGLFSLAGGIGKFASGVQQVKESKKINPIFNQYKSSPFAKQQLGIAQNMFNGRMAGAGGLERNLQSSQASQMANAGRNATDSSQLLALGGASQGLTNDALGDLQIREAQNKQAMLQNLNQAYETNIGEGNKEYDSMLEKYKMDSQRKDALRSSGAQNKYGALSDMASLGFSAAGAGGLGSMFGGGGGGGMQQFGGSGMGAAPYGASVYGQLTGPRQRLTLGG
jgi:hypothetical protein